MQKKKKRLSISKKIEKKNNFHNVKVKKINCQKIIFYIINADSHLSLRHTVYDYVTNNQIYFFSVIIYKKMNNCRKKRYM